MRTSSPPGVPVLDGLGAQGGGAHACPHVRLDTLPLRARVLARLLEDPGLPGLGREPLGRLLVRVHRSIRAAQRIAGPASGRRNADGHAAPGTQRPDGGDRLRIFSATSRASSGVAPASSTANSSPPIRATRSARRTQLCNAAATWRSSSSPATCPSVSFTRLKPSRSSISSAAPPVRFSQSTSSLSLRAFQAPVRASRAARSFSLRSRRLRSVTSVATSRPASGPSGRHGDQPVAAPDGKLQLGLDAVEDSAVRG